MGRIEYDFRDGLDKDHLIYKKKGNDCKFCCYYLLYLLATYINCALWYALFHYAYINHEPIAFWVYVGCWLFWVLTIVVVAIINLCIHHSHKKKLREEKQRRLDEEKARKLAEDAGELIQPAPAQKTEDDHQIMNKKANVNSNDNEKLINH